MADNGSMADARAIHRRGAPAASGAPARTLLRGWGRTPASAADVVHPLDADDAAAIVAATGDQALARGMGRSYGDAALNAGGLVLDMTRVAGIRAIDEVAGTVTAAAGTTLGAIIAALLPRGWFLPVVPGTRHVSVAGAIAADIHGKNHHADGGFQRHVKSFELLTADGQRRHVDRAHDAALFAATFGGLGLTGVILEATLELMPVETAYMRVDRERVPNLEALMERMAESDARYRYSVAWVDCTDRRGRGVLMRANHALAGELPLQYRGRPLAAREGSAVSWPAWLPGGMLRRSTLRLANEVYFRRPAMDRRDVFEPFSSYFFPLDRVGEWNRAYGRRGFVQYQFVLPDRAADVVRAAFDRISPLPVALAVLKRMGPGHGLLSFPIEGWTLAADIPAGAEGLAETLDAVDALVAAAGGRVYLAKDARLRPEVLPLMYPEIDRWRAIRDAADPGRRFRSDLGERLGLL